MNIDDARRLFESGRLDEAENAYLALAREAEQRSEALYGLGLVALRRRQWDIAERWLIQSLHENSRDPNTRFYLGNLAERRGDAVLATRYYAEALSINPQHAGAIKSIAGMGAGNDQQRPAARSDHAAAGVSDVTPPRPPSTGTGNRVLGRPPHPPSSPDAIVGMAKLVKLQAVPFNGSPAGRQCLTFRLDVVDAAGRKIETVAVEMRGFAIRGGLENGDWVEVRRIKRNGTAKSCRNLSTGGRITVRLF